MSEWTSDQWLGLFCLSSLVGWAIIVWVNRDKINSDWED